MQQQPDFAMIPGRDEIEKLERDIRFFPTSVAAPQSLTAAEIARWNETGYLAPLTAYDGSQAEDLREYFDRLLNQTLAAGNDSYSISSAHLKHARVWDLLNHPAIVAPVCDLLGPNVIGWGAHFFCKMPGDGKRVDWHQDCSYWPLTPTKTVTVWLAIDDADAENGCMEVFAGSHRFGLIDFEASDASSGNVLNQTVSQPEKYGQLESEPLQAGQFSLHSDLLLHGSPANQSGRRRCGLTLRYCPADVTASLDWNRKGVIVAGEADPEKWPNAPRPQAD
ncbi:Phytanoyl-CoA dioxygenase (PhyH) [Roseimaritima multifibrata]|uniref:Phytanoyl-CoA dioxygenase (PhyH) n=1 Tax=Roseimaritima multifibrata TaxID=1930274 RepID=A0A517MBP9_9BACT|nr:phytanoyl-CoA dioxygenase family protein [Roseimaritima multifibrata]QDS92310.1 Phytanoyl-CoA dioxygenase (PhyH) [Roseimaritima multifibrata]